MPQIWILPYERIYQKSEHLLVHIISEGLKKL